MKRKEDTMIGRISGTSGSRWLVGSALILLAACGDSPSEPANMVDSGSWYRSGFRWPHDGNPYESQHFKVYSDAASMSARQRVAEIGEELLVQLKQDFVVSDSMFVWPAGQSKIHIYTYRDRHPQEWGGWGYYGGLLIYSLDHPGKGDLTEITSYTRVVTHELMHVIEGLLKGTDNPNLVDVWMTEGIAEYVAGGTQTIGRVTSLAKLDSLVATFGELNPIAMHRYDYPDIPNVGGYYYVMFDLAVEYLLDPAGLAQAKPGVRDIFLDARRGVPFASSIEERLGIGLQDYEDEFWDRIRGYLN
jgi:hypothetical protein